MSSDLQPVFLPNLLKEVRNDFKVVQAGASNLPLLVKVSVYFLAACKIIGFYLWLVGDFFLTVSFARLSGACWNLAGRGRIAAVYELRKKAYPELRARYKNWLASSTDLQEAHGTLDFFRAVSHLVMFLAWPLIPFLMLWQAMSVRERKKSNEALRPSKSF